MAMLLPDVTMFLYTYVRKEAVLSSMIEGTQSSLADLMLFELDEMPSVPLDDVREVSNYVAAMDLGVLRIENDFPISLRLLREMHAVLLRHGRGSDHTPGEFRRSQNWIGGTRPGNALYVPPPAGFVQECMGELEKFINDMPEVTPPLIKAALVHVQFETIHPFLDGNGRLGRLLITLILLKHGFLHKPLLYLSLYFKTHRSRYYDLLTLVRTEGRWEEWLDFFADAVIETATQAVETAQQLLALLETDRQRINTLKRAGLSCHPVHLALSERPISNARWLVERTGLTAMTVNKALGQLQQLGIVTMHTAQKRNRTYVYRKYIDVMNRGTELP
jgi:Fic family protein